MKPGDWVRVRPHGNSQHHVGALIVAVNRTKVVIRPILHGRLEVVNVMDCRPWKSRNVQRRSVRQRRAI
jgi:hypothetical protein